VSAPIFTADELAQVKAYVNPLYARLACNIAFDFLLSFLLLRFGVRPLYALCERAAGRISAGSGRVRRVPVVRVVLRALERLWGGEGWGAALLFALLVYALVEVINLPITYYFGFVHEHRFGLSNQTAWAFWRDTLKAFVMVATALGLLAFGLFGLVRRTRKWWWLLGIAASAAMLVSSALDPYRSRLYYDQTPLAEGALRGRLTALLDRAHVEFRDIVVEKTSQDSNRVQAYFAGQGPTRTIVLNDALLRAMSDDEVVAVVAHEAGHVQEPRWPNRLASVAALFGFLFVIDRLFRRGAERRWFGVSSPADIRLLPLVSFTFFVLRLALMPASSALSRERERAADRYAIALTQDRATFARMLTKAAHIDRMDPDPPRWVVLLASSHPPIAERIAAAEAK
jgi:STE24 endopeptidase